MVRPIQLGHFHTLSAAYTILALDAYATTVGSAYYKGMAVFTIVKGGAMYQATVYPIYVVIDKDGYVAGTQHGAAGEDALRDLLARGGLDDDDSDDK